MVGRHTFLVVGLMAAGGAPYVSSKAGFQDKPSTEYSTQHSEVGHTNYSSTSADLHAAATASPMPPTRTANPFGGATIDSVARVQHQGHSIYQASSSPSATHSPENDNKPKSPDTKKSIRFEDVFRLDINSAWLMTHWPRVTTGLAEPGLHGYRVALHTGTKEDDLAGALTYYYDKNQVIQKMTFRGRTGDPRSLVHFATSQYNLVQVTVDDPALQVFRTKGLGKRASELIVRPAQVIRADAPRERFDVEFTLLR